MKALKLRIFNKNLGFTQFFVVYVFVYTICSALELFFLIICHHIMFRLCLFLFFFAKTSFSLSKNVVEYNFAKRNGELVYQDNGDLTICFLATKTNDPKYKYLVKLLDEASKEFRDDKEELDHVSFTYLHFDDEKNEKMLKNYGIEEKNGNQIVLARLLKIGKG